MAPGADPEPAEVPSWTATERGAFMFGRCHRCDFQSPGRRARYSMESDMRAHALLCAPAHLGEDPAGPTSSPAAAAVDGWREREVLRRAGSASRHRAARSG